MTLAQWIGPLEGALETLPLPVFSIDAGGVVVWQNAAARTAFGDLRGRHYDEVIPAEELPGTRDRFTKLMLGKSTSRARNVIRVGSEDVPVEVTATPIREGGKIVGVLGMAVPLTAEPEVPRSEIRLSPRQHEVLQLLAKGKSTEEISDTLHLAPATVRNYISGLLRVLDAGTRLEAVLIGLRAGLVSLEVTD
jgi:PAS domain S-box-containing protein